MATSAITTTTHSTRIIVIGATEGLTSPGEAGEVAEEEEIVTAVHLAAPITTKLKNGTVIRMGEAVAAVVVVVEPITGLRVAVRCTKRLPLARMVSNRGATGQTAMVNTQLRSSHSTPNRSSTTSAISSPPTSA